MKQFAIIGVSAFGKRVLDELLEVDCEIILIDKRSELVDLYKDIVTSAYIADVINEATINKLIPADIDAVIVDLGDNIEASILVTKYLKNKNIKNIVVKAETDQHGEILKIVGADHVVFPYREAAIRVIPMLVSSLLFNYMSIGNGLVMAEIRVPEAFIGQSLIEANIRAKRGINVVAIRNEDTGDAFDFFSPEVRLQIGDILLVVGKEQDVTAFGEVELPERKKGLGNFFKYIFPKK
jgi:trk system potassium uptake protein TrkA